LAGGKTAASVAEVRIESSLVYKLDALNPDTAAEGEMIRRYRADTRMPDAWREAWPAIFAVSLSPPYGYAMERFACENGWKSFDDCAYPGADCPGARSSEIQRCAAAALDSLFAGYSASVNRRSLPNLRLDLVERIRSRLNAAAAVDSRYSPRAWRVNGNLLPAWDSMLEAIEQRVDWLALAPPFTTWIHGDCHPGNLIVRSSPQGVEVKLIDAKLRGASGADYLIDVARLVQFLTITLPVQKPIGAIEFTVDDEAATLDYHLELPAWTEAVVQACLDRTDAFASAQGDRHWRDRLDLNMAADMLGLIAGRLEAGHGDDLDLLVWFGDGLGLLSRFCERF
jgi:hypothetical protein